MTVGARLIPRKHRKPFWTLRVVDEVKAEIKAELREIPSEALRLEHVLTHVQTLEDDLDPKAQLHRYIYTIFALLHHSVHGGLKRNQINQLADLANAILQTQNVQPFGSKLSFLHGEIPLVLSQIYRKEGMGWLSAWEQQLHFQHVKDLKKGFHHLSFGIRALRLGHAAIAIGALQKAEDEGLDEAQMPRARLEKIKALRLSGRVSQSIQLIKESNSLFQEKFSVEAQWEQLCCQATQSSDISQLISNTHKKKIHHELSYLSEAFLWSRCTESPVWKNRYPTLKSLIYDSQINPLRSNYLIRCILDIEYCTDESLPFYRRAQRIRKLIRNMHRLITVDEELLVWATLSRWLAKSKAWDMARLVLAEYQALSLKLSSCQNPDALGLMGDLIQKPWFQDLTPQNQMTAVPAA